MVCVIFTHIGTNLSYIYNWLICFITFDDLLVRVLPAELRFRINTGHG